RGLNDTSTIPSPPPDSLSPASSPAGSLVVPSAITLGSDHARALGSSTRCPNTRNESFRHSSAILLPPRCLLAPASSNWTGNRSCIAFHVQSVFQEH